MSEVKVYHLVNPLNKINGDVFLSAEMEVNYWKTNGCSVVELVSKSDYDTQSDLLRKAVNRCADLEARLGKLDKEFFLRVIENWQAHWMNQKFNEQDTQNYRRRAMSVDANMSYGLARMLFEALTNTRETK